MKKSVQIWLHGFVWFCDFVMIFLTNYKSTIWEKSAIISVISVIGLFAITLAFIYIGYSYIVPTFFSKKKYFEGSLILLGICLIFPAFLSFRIIVSAITGHGWMGGYPLNMHFKLSIFFAIFSISGIFLRALENWFIEQQKKKELENEKLQSRLMVLTNQNNPHFIFNVLNNIDSLITSKPAKASETINKLSSLLRYIYSNSEKDSVSLTSEIEYIENYIELQSLRIDNEIKVKLDKENISGNVFVVPMLFLPFIENAFKHGLTSKTNPVFIKFSKSNGQLLFECKNSIDAAINKNSDSGFGLTNVRKRLDLMYPSKYNLDIKKNEAVYSVSLTLQINED